MSDPKDKFFRIQPSDLSLSKFVLLTYALGMSFVVGTHSTVCGSISAALAFGIYFWNPLLLNHLPRNLKNPEVFLLSARRLMIVLLLILIYKPYQIPISLNSIASVPEGNDQMTRFYGVIYYAPNSPRLRITVAHSEDANTYEVKGWVSYTPLDFLYMNHQNVIEIRGIKPGSRVFASDGGRS
jgi:hypothetical protein